MKSEKISNQCYFHYYHLCYCCCYCQCLHNDNVYSIILVILLLVSISISLPYDLLPTAFYGLLKYFFNVFFFLQRSKARMFCKYRLKKTYCFFAFISGVFYTIMTFLLYLISFKRAI